MSINFTSNEDLFRLIHAVIMNDLDGMMANIHVLKPREKKEELVDNPKQQAIANLLDVLQQVASSKVVVSAPLEVINPDYLNTKDEDSKMGAREDAERLARHMDSQKKNNTLDKVGPKAHVADIVYHGEQLILPRGMGIPDAVNLLLQRQEFLERIINFNETFDALPYDGAHAINEVLSAKFGWAQSVPTPGFWGDKPPEMVNVQTGVHTWKTVPWGRFSLPGIDGHIQTSLNATPEGRFQFKLDASIKKKDEETVRDIFSLVRAHLKGHSIYRGQALKIRFKKDDGDTVQMPIPEFIDTSRINPDMLIYSREVENSVRTNLFTPIERCQDFAKNNLPIKRVVMLAGTYGTGKTLAATVASKKAVEHGITYIYCTRADELPQALEFARQYQSPASVVFCEDIDRELDGKRDAQMDDILNLVDGIDTKNNNIITVLTSNAIENINAAMLRPGRMDAIIDVTPPDAEAVSRLIRAIGGSAIPAETNLDAAAAKLAGNIPAVIAEVVKRAKISQLALSAPGTIVTELSEAAILDAAATMEGQLRLLKAKVDAGAKAEPEIDTAFRSMVREELLDLAAGGNLTAPVSKGVIKAVEKMNGR
jgi:transitional endoplasmic reticulum ATPase